MRTAALAALALLVVLAGCAFAVGQSSGPVPPTTERCLTEKVPDPDALEPSGNVSVQQYPEAPTTDNETAIREFVVRFERAYLLNLFLQGGHEFDRIDLRYWNATTERQFDGYEITSEGGISTYYADGGHGDGVLSPEYFVNGTTVRRNAGFGGDRWNVVLVNCDS